jgi:hypothetical protein
MIVNPRSTGTLLCVSRSDFSPPGRLALHTTPSKDQDCSGQTPCTRLKVDQAVQQRNHKVLRRGKIPMSEVPLSVLTDHRSKF